MSEINYPENNNEKYFRKITIIDCFIQNDRVEEKLENLISKIKSLNEDVLLISNTPAKKSIIEMCDFYIYDRRNQLFENEYTGVEDVDFFNSCGDFIVHNIKPGVQRHGLSVLVNLFTALDFVKYNYTHFRRLECDDIFGPDSLNIMVENEMNCINQNKKGIFYFNDAPSERNISFHYFFCDIRYFQRKIERIENEKDYIKYLLTHRGNLDFVIVEKYIYENFKRNGHGDLICKDGVHDMALDFPDTVWNTETSGSNISEKYRGCITDVYNKYNRDDQFLGLAVYSYNYINQERERKIRVNLNNGESYYIIQKLEFRGSWYLMDVPENISSIDVYENEELLYSQETKKIKSYLKWE